MALYEDPSVAPPPAMSAALGQLSVPSGHPFLGAGVPFPAYQPSPGQRVAAVLQQLLATPVPHRPAPHDLPLVGLRNRPAPHDLPLGNPGGISPGVASVLAALRGQLLTPNYTPPGLASGGGHLTY